ncbi:hypothetical protein SEA_UPYO_43 [Gordonia phage Upyo]|nr:hypothetical protein SEA_UPYO_43 [Gordonia phage Upyo]
MGWETVADWLWWVSAALAGIWWGRECTKPNTPKGVESLDVPTPEVRADFHSDEYWITLPSSGRPKDPWPPHTSHPKITISQHPGLKVGDAIPFVQTAATEVLPFTAVAVCPRCGRQDTHGLERINPWAPTIDRVEVPSESTEIHAWGQRYTRAQITYVSQFGDPPERGTEEWELYLRGRYVLSRQDERGYEVIRRCLSRSCQHRWPMGKGQPVLQDPHVDPRAVNAYRKATRTIRGD